MQVEAPPISDGDYLTAWHMLVLPVAAEFRPDLILVSAGFDAADKDPLGAYVGFRVVWLRFGMQHSGGPHSGVCRLYDAADKFFLDVCTGSMVLCYMGFAMLFIDHSVHTWPSTV